MTIDASSSGRPGISLGLVSSDVTSNAAFLAPAVLGLVNRMPLAAALAILTGLVSLGYHLMGGPRWRAADAFMAWGLVLHNMLLLLGSGFAQPFSTLAVAALAPALWTFFVRRKDDWEWHTSSAVITTLCMLSWLEAAGDRLIGALHGLDAPGSGLA